jgi:hypothetical protein
MMILWRAYRWTYLSFSPEGQSNIHTTAKKNVPVQFAKELEFQLAAQVPVLAIFVVEEVV